MTGERSPYRGPAYTPSRRTLPPALGPDPKREFCPEEVARRRLLLVVEHLHEAVVQTCPRQAYLVRDLLDETLCAAAAWWAFQDHVYEPHTNGADMG